MNTISRIFQKFRDSDYRKAFVGSQIRIGIPFQIRALIQRRGWTQEILAQKTGIKQPTISTLTRPGASQPNIKTLVRLAEAFDCGLAVRFVPFSELARWSDDFDPTTFNAPPFEDDLKLFAAEDASSPSGKVTEESTGPRIRRKNVVSISEPTEGQTLLLTGETPLTVTRCSTGSTETEITTDVPRITPAHIISNPRRSTYGQFCAAS